MDDMLNPAFFNLPIHDLRQGYLSDAYFWREKRTLEQHGLHPHVTMQVFQKKEAILCGVEEALEVLRVATGRYLDYERAAFMFERLKSLRADPSLPMEDVPRIKAEISAELDSLWENNFADLEIRTLRDGDQIEPWESVMHITGDAASFAHLETIYLGILSRRTRIATNVRAIVEAAKGKQVLYFPARHDHWSLQAGDGYAAHIGGTSDVSTDAQGEWFGGRGMGTIPHALIAACGGDTVKAVRLFHKTYPDVNLIALVDFDNDSVGTSLACAREMGLKLWGVRLDTSETIVDKSIESMQKILPNPRGVGPELVFMVRQALDNEGFDHVKIVVSAGFNLEKIRTFEHVGAPVDAYGVGSAFMTGEFDFTGDIVLVNGEECAKVGREYRPNPKMISIEHEIEVTP